MSKLLARRSQGMSSRRLCALVSSTFATDLTYRSQPIAQTKDLPNAEIAMVSVICQKNVLNQRIGLDMFADIVVKMVCLLKICHAATMLTYSGHGSEKMCIPEDKAAFAAAQAEADGANGDGGFDSGFDAVPSGPVDNSSACDTGNTAAAGTTSGDWDSGANVSAKGGW